MARHLEGRYGKLEILVNNAGSLWKRRISAPPAGLTQRPP
jgi:hypothetical protein